ncbi:HAD-IIA family hydrolase [Paenibacillus hemerocallicola]|uniref:Acid sugar phosphatase n=1 Tax=Paenibacillus hemerocallicola TaxID=1172614 RepID=A0A5C4SVT2_9BACL|nr:HAD-IIA family hydrolase [Paenibacillus hemerocallicola]TNJ57385.1 HAD-IIA family hydrolase [Paenibacillus hemerocallicola]
MPDVADYEGYFFDLDGTVFLGDRLLPGVKETLALLREKRKKVQFLSNTTIRTRRQCQARLHDLGLEARLDEIVTAAYVAAVYMRERSPEPTVLVIGEPALATELKECGVGMTSRPEEATHVLVGMDMQFDYAKLHTAMKAVRGGAQLIAANPDPNCPIVGDVIPDTWSMVKAIEAASCVEPAAVVGKPSAYYASKVLEWAGLRGERCLMIGDRLETDILFGSVNGLHTALVLTGVTTDREAERSPIRPDYLWRTLEQFVELARPIGYSDKINSRNTFP